MIYDCKNKEIVRALEKKMGRIGWVGGTESVCVDINVTERNQDEVDAMISSIPETNEWWWDIDTFCNQRYLSISYVEE